jgi:hypothetical protein
LPTKKAQFPNHLYNTSYYVRLRQALSTLSEEEKGNLPNLKLVRSISNMKMLSGEVDWKYLKAKDYDYVVIEYFTDTEKQSFMKKIDFSPSQFMLVKTIAPSKKITNISTVLNIENPVVDLFSIDRFGPYFEIYEKRWKLQ